MKNKQFFVLILFLVIGFASISATLVINGNTKVAANIDDFNVIFIEGFLNGETNEDVVISGDKKTLTFTTNKLTNINDTARIDYKVKNISTQYDGDVTINCTNEANNYVNVTSSFDGNSLPLSNSINMQAQEVKSGYINTELIKPATEDQEIKVTCRIDISATSRTNYAYSLTFNSNGGTDVEDKIVEYNTSYGELGIPEKEGYTFIGWFNEEDVLVDENTILNTKGNKTLTAKWAEKSYPVSLNKVYTDRTETSEINIPYGESVNTLITTDDKYFINNIECDNGYTITNYDKETVIYGSQTITINNNRKATSSTCNITVLQGIYDYSYTGSEQEFYAPIEGNYKIELWGAQGYGGSNAGGYVSGIITLETKMYYIYVGGSPSPYYIGGYNGGGKAGYSTRNSYGYAGGGATDVRLVNGTWSNFESLKSRIMVAGGGGASGLTISKIFSDAQAGGLIGYTPVGTPSSSYVPSLGKGGSQTKGGAIPTLNSYAISNGTAGGFGYAGDGGNSSSSEGGGGGGSGYYGGSGSSGLQSGIFQGGGGSSFISGHNGCDAIAENSTQTNIIHTGQPNHYSGYVFTDTVMIDGAGYKWTNVKGEQTGMPTHDGTGRMMGKSGNGYAKITFLGK